MAAAAARAGRGIPAMILGAVLVIAAVGMGMGMGMESRPRRELSGTVAARRRPENDRAKTCNVRDYGAVGDGVTKDTAAIQRTIAACANDSVILLPAPYQFLTAPFNLTSHTTLRIETGAALLASDDLDDWFIIAPLPSYPNGREARNPQRYVSFIGGNDLVDVAIDGGGLIDGMGEQWCADSPRGQRISSTEAVRAQRPWLSLSLTPESCGRSVGGGGGWGGAGTSATGTTSSSTTAAASLSPCSAKTFA